MCRQLPGRSTEKRVSDTTVNTIERRAAIAVVLVVVYGAPLMANAVVATPHSGTKVIKTGISYEDLVKSLNAAVKAKKMGLVTRASATVGAKRLGNMIVG